MRRSTVVWLVARREIIERGRSRGYLVSLLFTLALLVMAFVLPVLTQRDDTRRLALVGTPPAALRSTIAAIVAQSKTKFVITSVPDEAAAEAQLRAKTVDAAFEVPQDASSSGTLLFQEARDATIADVCYQAVVVVRAGPDVLSPPQTRIIAPPADDHTAAVILATAGIILMFIGIFTYGQWVLTGVVEEKQSRVVEVLLSTIRPRDLLVGKVLGIAALAMGQLAALVVVGLGVSQLFGQVALPPTTLGGVIQLVLWFVLGFFFYATAMGALGSLASRPDEANNAAMPVTMSATLCYVGTLVFVIQDPSGGLAQVMTFIPFSAPMVVPIRVALAAAQPWEVVGAIAVMVVAIALLFEAGGRVYSGAVLSSGGRMKLRDAWRARR
jgi:ABC-2 type transport system permease protein